MISVAGIFIKLQGAQRAVDTLISRGIQPDKINLLTPNSNEAELQKVPTSDTEAPGAAKAFGGFVGGALGAAGGMQLGATAASLVIPGVGPILAFGTAAAVLIGAGGVVGGAAFGEYMEESFNEGLPKDELFLYQDALRKGWSVLIVFAKDLEEGEMVKEALGKAGAESLDAARENWWKALRKAEEAEYGGDFSSAEYPFRQGFEAAHDRRTREKSFEEALPFLKTRYSGELCKQEAFRRGYERGKKYR